MAFSSGGGSGPMADINVTPLVDVMLVLLIIFMITAPIMSQKIKIDLPQPSKEQQKEIPPDPITLSIKENGEMYWNDDPIPNEMMLQTQLAVTVANAESTGKPQPELQIKADNNTQYQSVATVMADAKNAGMTKIGFVATAANPY